jgi:predicted TIM-barrel fold metal-dependent hydrolase
MAIGSRPHSWKDPGSSPRVERASRARAGCPPRSRFHYDTALSATPFALSALQALVGPDRIVFGSDAPFAPEFIVAESVKGLWTHGRFDAAGRHAVARGNAIRLFPSLAARLET